MRNLGEVEVFVDETAFRGAPEAQKRKLRELVRRLEIEPFMGDRIRRAQIPKRFRGLPNLFRLPLPGGWRALHTVASSPLTKTEIRVVWIGDHVQYNRLFGY